MITPDLIALTSNIPPSIPFIAGLTLLILLFWYFATDIERRKRNVGTVLVLGVIAICLFVCFPVNTAFKGGIDLVGGSSFTLKVQPRLDETGKETPVRDEDVKQAIKTIEQRVNHNGVVDMIIAKQGEDKIQLQMPGMSTEQSEHVKELLQQVAKLELREVSQEGFEVTAGGKSLAELVFNGDEIRPGFKAYKHEFKREDGTAGVEYLLLNKRAALTGKDVQAAFPYSMGETSVQITLNDAGGEKMNALTKGMTPGRDRIAVLLDDKVLTAPTVQSVPLGKQFSITGQRSLEEARELANALLNPLENPLKIEYSTAITPTLGAAAVKQGIYSGIAGLCFTAIFILLYYRMAGLVALLGLIVNAVMIFGVMAMFGATFTLPGIAGMILTIGMAVDANVLIYERLREETRAGKSLKTAIAASYEKAFTAIFDSNITSLITAIILFWKGSSSVMGFAVTLTIGLLCSLFSAILVTRVLFRWATDLNLLSKLSFLDLVKSKNFDFLGKRKTAYVISIALTLLCIGGFVVRKEKALGIDFTGGTMLTFQLGKEQLGQQEVEKDLSALQTSKQPSVQVEKSDLTGNSISIRVADTDADKVVDFLRQKYPLLAETKTVLDAEGKETGTKAYVAPLSRDTVSATFGLAAMKDSGIALVLGLLGIMIYVTLRFEFSFALGGFIAILHDVIVSIGVIVLLGREVSMTHVGAILTIAGYSINDTIIIFDRIRESLKAGGSQKIETIMNEAINATLSRTILTSLATLISVSAMTFFGGASMEAFSTVILVGIVVGTYSSIFIASPIVLWWSKRKGGDLRDEIARTEKLQAELKATP
jgi:SecD/SecF fusion protein